MLTIKHLHIYLRIKFNYMGKSMVLGRKFLHLFSTKLYIDQLRTSSQIFRKTLFVFETFTFKINLFQKFFSPLKGAYNRWHSRHFVGQEPSLKATQMLVWNFPKLNVRLIQYKGNLSFFAPRGIKNRYLCSIEGLLKVYIQFQISKVFRSKRLEAFLFSLHS